MVDAEVRALLDKQEITEVLTRYCRAVDRYDVALLRSVYWSDGTDAHGAFDGSAEEFCQFIEQVADASSPYKVTQHILGNILIELAGNKAHAESYFQAYHRFVDGDEAYDEFVGGRYVDLMERRDGEWRIKDRRCIYEWARKEPGTERFWDRWPGQFIFGARDKSDAVYAPVSS